MFLNHKDRIIYREMTRERKFSIEEKPHKFLHSKLLTQNTVMIL
jgi:hypothetical protein